MKSYLFLFSVIIAALLPHPCFAQSADTSIISREWFNEPFSAQAAKFKEFTLIPHPNDKGLVAADCASDPGWWSELRVFKHQGDRIEWAATFPKEYIQERGCYIVSCRWISFGMLTTSVLEIFESTHMGNGSLWLLELDNQKFRVLLHTPARGRCWSPAKEFAVPQNGEARFEGDHLNVEYRKHEGEKFEEVYLTGKVLITDMEGAEVSSQAYEEKWVWDAKKRVFHREEIRTRTTAGYFLVQNYKLILPSTSSAHYHQIHAIRFNHP